MNTFRRKLSLASGLGLNPAQLSDQPFTRAEREPLVDFRRIESFVRESAQRSRGWLRRLLTSHPLELELTDRTVRLQGLAEFEFALASRTEFPIRKLPELMQLPPVEIKRVATNIRQVEKRFADLLAESLDEPGSIGFLLKGLELKLFSQDHGWRDIMEALIRQPPAFDDFKKLAVVKYMQYLGARQDVLRSIYLEKKAQRDGREPLPAVAPDPEATAICHGTDGGSALPMHETAIFDDMTRVMPAGGSEGKLDFRALRRGETVCVQLGQGGELPLQLSRQHTFRLAAGWPMQLVDEGGATYLLHDARNVVGRHAGNEVVVDGSYRTVSRKHLVIEPLGPCTALLTDLSAHGTFVPARSLSGGKAAPAP